MCQSVMPSRVSRSATDVVGEGRVKNARCIVALGAKFCQKRGSLLAPDPHGGASRWIGLPNIRCIAGCSSVPGTFSSMYPTPCGWVWSRSWMRRVVCKRALLRGSCRPRCLPASEYGWQGGPAITMSMPSGNNVSVAGERELALKGRRRSQCWMDVGGRSVGKRA